MWPAETFHSQQISKRRAEKHRHLIEIAVLEKIHKLNYSPRIYKKLLMARAKLGMIQSGAVEKPLRYTRRRCFHTHMVIRLVRFFAKW